MTLESIEKLREVAADINSTEIIDNLDVVGKFMFHSEWLDSWHKAFDAACDEIEREIAENYIALPKDADGKSWHLGDITENGNRVNGMTFDSHGWHFTNTLNDIDPSIHRHVKPDPLKALLEEFATDLANYKGDVDFDTYAERIREALGVE